MLNGAFVGRRADENHNAVSPDMLLEQTYNADAKEESVLDAITLNIAARTKWVYTKPVTAAVSAQLKSMLYLHGDNPHHESGQIRLARDVDTVLRVLAGMLTNPFMATATSLVNISTGQHAESEVEADLIHAKDIGLKALSDYLSGNQKKTNVVKLKTFHIQTAQAKKSKPQSAVPGKSDEVAALLRITQIAASGGEVDIVNFIGKHECSKRPQSLFNEDGSMRSAGTKSTFVKALKEETKVSSSPSLPPEERKTAVVVDAMYAIRRWSFHKEETFSVIGKRHLHNHLLDIYVKKTVQFIYSVKVTSWL